MNLKQKIGIIGYTGLIGKILFNELNYERKFLLYKYNSKNIEKINNKNFDKIYCAGLPAEKWRANKFPLKDKQNINKLSKILKSTNCKNFILISTIDVHKKKEIYGRNRLKFENFIKKKFKKYLIIRLPAVFGKGLKKNLLFDLLNKNNLENIFYNDKFQWFDLSQLYKEIKKKMNLNLNNKIIELYSPPIENSEILRFFPNIKIDKKNKKKTTYNFKPKNGYYRNKKFILKRIKKFINERKY